MLLSGNQHRSIREFIAGSAPGLELVNDLHQRGYREFDAAGRVFSKRDRASPYSYTLDGSPSAPNTVKNTIMARRAPTDPWEPFSYIHTNGVSPTLV